MKCVLLAVLIAAAATAAVVSNDVRDVADKKKVAEVNETPEVIVTDLFELADEAGDAEETAVASRRNLSQGSIGSSDVLVHNSELRENPVPGHYIIRSVPVTTFRRITAIRVTRVGTSSNATPSIVSGGIGQSSVRIRIQSAPNRGFHYRVQVYAR